MSVMTSVPGSGAADRSTARRRRVPDGNDAPGTGGEGSLSTDLPGSAGIGTRMFVTDRTTTMSDVIDEELYRRTEALLEPGEIDLNGVIVHTDIEGDNDIAMQELTVEVNEVIATHAGEPENVYVYAGNDSTDFASNQHQGRTLDDDAFVWECQQLLREGSFDLVFYYEASADHEAIRADLRDAGYTVTGVRGDH